MRKQARYRALLFSKTPFVTHAVSFAPTKTCSFQSRSIGFRVEPHGAMSTSGGGRPSRDRSKPEAYVFLGSLFLVFFTPRDLFCVSSRAGDSRQPWPSFCDYVFFLSLFFFCLVTAPPPSGPSRVNATVGPAHA